MNFTRDKVLVPHLHPGRYFLLFATAGALLSYIALPTVLGLLTFLLGIALPLVVGFRAGRKGMPTKGKMHEMPSIPFFWFWMLFIVAIGLRFYRMTSLSPWPLADDSIPGFIAAELTEHWEWRAFYNYNQIPALTFWILVGFFKIFGVSLGSLWLFPAVCSALTLPIGYWAARQFFLRQQAVLLTLLLGFGFWPMYAGRFCNQFGPLLLWECLLLGVMGLALKQTSKRHLIFLGLLGSVGFYIYAPPGIMISLTALGAVIIFSWCRHRKGRFRSIGFILIPFLLGSAPPVVWSIRNHYGRWILHLVDGGGDFTVLGRIKVFAGYLSGLFWKAPPETYYGPLWGGLFNPLLGALLIIGLLGFWRERRSSHAQWLLFSSALLLAPGVFTEHIQYLRILPALPILLVFVLKGFEFLLRSQKKGRQVRAYYLILVASVFLDLIHLFGVYPAIFREPEQSFPGRTLERYNAYLLMKEAFSKIGPGLVLDEFSELMTYQEQSLFIATYTFNTARNPRLRLEDSRWAAVLTNIHYRPFLERRFPTASFTVLSAIPLTYQSMILAFIPVDPSNMGVLKRWAVANRALQDMVSTIMRTPHGVSWNGVIARLRESKALFEGDPFLQSCYWQNLAILYYRERCLFPDHLDAVYQALKNGYPAAHLYYQMGILLFHIKNFQASREAFQAAMNAPFNATNSAELFSILYGSHP